jgi:hypothetical protein
MIRETMTHGVIGKTMEIVLFPWESGDNAMKID